MSKLGSGIIEELFRGIPRGVIDYVYFEYSNSYILYFFSGDEYSCIDGLSELDLIIIIKSIRELIHI